MANSRPDFSSGRDTTGSGRGSNSQQASGSQSHAAAALALTLERVIGQTCLHNNALAINPLTGDVAYPAGCIVVIYQPRRNRQFRYFRASKTVSCLAFSRDGGMLAVGERGHQPAVTVWNLASGTVLRELTGGHRFGIGCVAFTPSGHGVVTMGFKHDRMLKVWDLHLGRTASGIGGQPPEEGPLSPAYVASDWDPDASPPLPRNHRAPDAPSPSPRREEQGARQVAHAHVPQRVRSMDLTPDGKCLVTCGDRLVKFWTMPDGFHVLRDTGGIGSEEIAINGVDGKAGGVDAAVPSILEGRAVTIVDELTDEIFVGVACGKGGQAVGMEEGGGEAAEGAFCVTAGGVLCYLSRDGVMQKWVSLEVPAAYGVSLLDGTVAAACANGLVRLFQASDLRYMATLPRPPPLGHANIASIRDLQDITASAAPSMVTAAAEGKEAEPAELFSSSAGVESRQEGSKTAGGERGREQRRDSGGGAIEGGGAVGGLLRYPAVLGCRLSPSGTKVVCVYADRGLFIWDITDPLCVGKYRSFLAHGGCIWDVQRMPARVPSFWKKGARQQRTAAATPGTPPDIPEGAMVTCSADNTIRLWDLGALDGRTDGEGHSGRWSNIYSKYLLRVLYTDVNATIVREDFPIAGGVTNSLPPDSTATSNSSLDTGNSSNGFANGCPTGQRANEPPNMTGEARDAARRAEEASAVETMLSQGVVDPELPSKPDWSFAPRSLAVHPDGLQVACGDRRGNIRVYDLGKMELAHEQAAHDAEVLCLAFSPILVPVPLTNPDSPAPAISRTSSPTRTSTDAGVNPKLSGGGAASGGGGAPSSVARSQKWDAIDPLGSSVASDLFARARECDDGREKGDTALVLLASASRDRLVHVFDASANRGWMGSAEGDGERGGDADKGDYGGEGGIKSCYPLLKTLDNHLSSVTAVKFSKDGKRLISTSGDKMLVLNNVRGPHIHRYKSVSVPQGTIFGLDVDPTNKYMVTAGQDKRLNIWSIATGRHVRGYKVEHPVLSGTPVAGAGGAGGVAGVASGGAGSGVRGGGGELFKVDLDPTGMYAATCSFDKWIRLFDFYSGKCLAKVAGHSGLATGVKFTPDGRRLVSTGGDGVMFVWRLSSELQQAMRDRMCELRAGSDTGAAIAGGLIPGHSTQATSSAVPSEPLAGDRLSVNKQEPPPSPQGGVSDAGAAAGPPMPAKTQQVGEARAKAKAEAKARLRFQRYQLPAWAHTQKATTAAASEGSETQPQDNLQATPIGGDSDDNENGVAVAPPLPPSRAEGEGTVYTAAGASAGRGGMGGGAKREGLQVPASRGNEGELAGGDGGGDDDGEGTRFVSNRSDVTAGRDETSRKTVSDSNGASGATIPSIAERGGGAAGIVDGGMAGGWGVRRGDRAVAVPQGRWGQRVLDESVARPQGPLEVLGRRAGQGRSLLERSPSPEVMTVMTADDLSHSRGEEDSVLLVDSDEEDEHGGYSEDGDFERSDEPGQKQRPYQQQQQQHRQRQEDARRATTDPIDLNPLYSKPRSKGGHAFNAQKDDRDVVSPDANSVAFTSPHGKHHQSTATRSPADYGNLELDRNNDQRRGSTGSMEASGMEGESYSWDGDDLGAEVRAAAVEAEEAEVGERAVVPGHGIVRRVGDRNGTPDRFGREEEKESVDRDDAEGLENAYAAEVDASSLRQSHSREFFRGLKQPDDRQHRRSHSRSSECSAGCGSLGEEDLDDVNFCASSPDGEADSAGDHVGVRGRRIIETEDAVEKMRQRLSAMGILEPGVAGGGDRKGDRKSDGGMAGSKSVKSSTKPETSKVRNTNWLACRDATAAAAAAGAAAVSASGDGMREKANAGVAGAAEGVGPSRATRIPSTGIERPPNVESGNAKDGGTAPAANDSLRQVLRSITSSSSSFKNPSLDDVDPRQAYFRCTATNAAAAIATSDTAVEIRPTVSAHVCEGVESDNKIGALARNTSVSCLEKPGWGRRQAGQRSGGQLVTATGALRRPDEEYETALLRLSAAAEHAAELYRELAAAAAEADSASLSCSAGSMEETIQTVGTESFALTPAAVARPGPAGTTGKHQQRTPRSDVLDVAEVIHSQHPQRRETGSPQTHQAGSNRSNIRDTRIEEEKGWERTGSLLESYRESFALVNDVLSVMSVSGANRADRTSTSAPVPTAATKTNRSSTDPHESNASSSPPRTGRAWAASPFIPRRKTGGSSESRAGVRTGSGSWSLERGHDDGRGGLALSHENGEHGETPRTIEGRDAERRVLADDAVPAEVSGLLRHYSELMLRAVQEKIDARLADGTLRSSSTRESDQSPSCRRTFSSSDEQDLLHKCTNNPG